MVNGHSPNRPKDKEAIMDDIFDFISQIENKFKVKCIHNEFRIIFLLYMNTDLPSLTLMNLAQSSISGHNHDLKRLTALGIVERFECPSDGRVRKYRLSDDMRTLIQNFTASRQAA
jgi:DNA-binding MarR family transcriptional regulator